MTLTAGQNITVLGGGAWGMALAAQAVRGGHKVALYARDAAIVAEINEQCRNSRYLSGIVLPAGIRATTDAAAALAAAQIVFVVFPAQALGAALAKLKNFIPPQAKLVLCAKGIERGTQRFMSEIVHDLVPYHALAALSGPSFATDVARGLPTAVTIAAEDADLAKELVLALSDKAFRCYASTDLRGVEIGGALKNVLALAAGMATGRGLGTSAQAALVTRGFAELRRIGLKLGGRAETMTGLAVLGDLLLTCSSPQSRNYAYGVTLGAGRPTDNLPLAEGVATAPVAAQLCVEHDIEAPLICAIAAVCAGKTTVEEAIAVLLSRPLKFED